MLPILISLLAALSLWLLLPRGTSRGRGIGAALGAAVLGFWASQWPHAGDWSTDGVFFVLAMVTIVSAIGAVTFRNPVYCAVWFGMSLLGTAGLFLAAGAQFLAVATVVVYAGAILVMFLFVLMLAQPEGRAAYDRTSWEAPLAAAMGVAIVVVLSAVVGGTPALPTKTAMASGDLPSSLRPTNLPTAWNPVGTVAFAAKERTSTASRSMAQPHVAPFGRELFGRHLIAVEIAGALLFIALVGAAVIVGLGGKKQSAGDFC